MQGSGLIVLELALVLGIVLFFGLRELRSLKRLREEREARARAEKGEQHDG